MTSHEPEPVSEDDDVLNHLTHLVSTSVALTKEADRLRQSTEEKIERAKKEYRVLGALLSFLLVVNLGLGVMQYQQSQEAQEISKDNAKILEIVESVTRPDGDVQRQSEQRFQGAVAQVNENLEATIREEVQQVLDELEIRGVIPPG